MLHNQEFIFYKSMFTYDLVTLSFVIYSTYTIPNAYTAQGIVPCHIKGWIISIYNVIIIASNFISISCH